MKLGYNVSVLSELAWLKDIPCLYWGDIDTHGLAILSRARGRLPQIRSILMDAVALLAHMDLWTREEEQSKVQPGNLTPDEQELYNSLKADEWGENVRLEQERISWAFAWPRILEGFRRLGSGAP
jgi:hypothetical protein